MPGSRYRVRTVSPPKQPQLGRGAVRGLSCWLQVPLPDVVSLQARQATLEGTGEITLR
jgi:hypothetical protein